jgi:hypothetical protein
MKHLNVMLLARNHRTKDMTWTREWEYACKNTLHLVPRAISGETAAIGVLGQQASNQN